MAFSGISYLAVLVAAIAGFVFGAAYYAVLGKQWMAAANLTADQVNRSNPVPYITAAVAHLVLAYMFAGLLGHLGSITLRGSLISAGFVWIGFIVTTMAVNHRFQGARPMLTVIDCGHWLGVLLVMAIVISSFGL